MIRELRENAKSAVEYRKVALEDTEDPAVLVIALRRIAKAGGGRPPQFPEYIELTFSCPAFEPAKACSLSRHFCS